MFKDHNPTIKFILIVLSIVAISSALIYTTKSKVKTVNESQFQNNRTVEEIIANPKYAKTNLEQTFDQDWKSTITAIKDTHGN